MKGLTHFVAGLAVASCFPEAVEAAAAGNPLYFLLGGGCGLLPDTLDFKIHRFWYPHTMELAPDPNAPDAGKMARALAWAIDQAAADTRTVTVKLDTLPVGCGAWRAYRVLFDTARGRVRVTFDPPPGAPTPSEATSPAPDAEAAAAAPFAIEYQAEVRVDILDGPVLALRPEPDGRVTVGFLPWHRTWTHSLLTAAALGALAGIAAGPLAGCVAALAFAAHALLDHAGHMGSALWYPLRRARRAGWQRVSSQDAFANFAVVWSALLLVLWNLARGTAEAALPFGRAALLGGALPLGLLWLAGHAPAPRAGRATGRRRRGPPAP